MVFYRVKQSKKVDAKVTLKPQKELLTKFLKKVLLSYEKTTFSNFESNNVIFLMLFLDVSNG